MISRDDLMEWYCDFDRMLMKYVKNYYEVEKDLNGIKFTLSLLLNDYIMDDVEIDSICNRYDKILLSLLKDIENLDHYQLYDEVHITLENIRREYEMLE